MLRQRFLHSQTFWCQPAEIWKVVSCYSVCTYFYLFIFLNFFFRFCIFYHTIIIYHRPVNYDMLLWGTIVIIACAQSRGRCCRAWCDQTFSVGRMWQRKLQMQSASKLDCDRGQTEGHLRDHGSAFCIHALTLSQSKFGVSEQQHKDTRDTWGHSASPF